MADSEAEFEVRLKDKVSGPAKKASAGVKSLAKDFTRFASKGLVNTTQQFASFAASALKFGAVAASGIAVGAAVGIAKIGSEFEQTQNQIAGFLQALGFTKDFEGGLSEADRLIKKINKDAAALPGEASDYIEVFRAGLPGLSGALGQNLDTLTAFSNRFTAVTSSLGVDSEQAGRDLAAMLSPIGRAGLDVKSFTQLLPFLQKLDGQANLTAASFNKMAQPERALLLAKALQTMDPMLEKAATSFDAQFGALQTSVKEIFRIGSKPIFEGMKGALGEVNALLMDSEGNLTPFSQGIVEAFKTAGSAIISALPMVKDFLATFASNAFETGKTALAALADVFTGLGGEVDTATVIKDIARALGKVTGIAIAAAVAFGAVAANLIWLGAKIVELAEGSFNWLVSGIGDIILWFDNLGAKIRAFDLAEAAANIGRSIVQGMINGITGAAGWLWEKVKSVAMGAVNAAKSALGISSPSKVFEDIGRQTTAGFAGGVDSSSPVARASMEDLVGSPMRTAGPSMGRMSPSQNNSVKLTVVVQAGEGADARQQGKIAGDEIARRLSSFFDTVALEVA